MCIPTPKKNWHVTPKKRWVLKSLESPSSGFSFWECKLRYCSILKIPGPFSQKRSILEASVAIFFGGGIPPIKQSRVWLNDPINYYLHLETTRWLQINKIAIIASVYKWRTDLDLLQACWYHKWQGFASATFATSFSLQFKQVSSLTIIIMTCAD